MKKIAFISLLFLISNGLWAQFTFGPKIGFTLHKLSVDQSTISTELNNSFTFGAFARIGKKVHLQPELNWFTAGGVFKRPSFESLSPFEQEVSLSTIQLPVLLGMKIINIKAACVRINIGPSANIVVNKKIKTLSLTDYISPIKKSDIKNLQWGLNLGAGVDLLMFTLDVKLMLGLTSMIDYVEIQNDQVRFDTHSNAFLVSLGWKIF